MKRVKLQWKWYDLWVGVYIDTPGRAIYVCPLPTIVLRIYYGSSITLAALSDYDGIESPLDTEERKLIEQGMVSEASDSYAVREGISQKKADKVVAEYLEARIKGLNKAIEGGKGGD